MNLKRILSSLVVATCCLLPLSASAELKIGVIDMQTIFTTSPQVKTAMEALKTEFKDRELAIVATEKSLKENSEKLQRNAAVMGKDEKARLEREVMSAQRTLQRLQTEFREDANLRQQEEMKKLVLKVNTVVAKIAKQEKYDLILQSEATPFFSKQVNITEKVIKAFTASA